MRKRKMTKQEYINLIKELNQHNINYYVNNTPTISDYDYDQKFTQLKISKKIIQNL